MSDRPSKSEPPTDGAKPTLLGTIGIGSEGLEIPKEVKNTITEARGPRYKGNSGVLMDFPDLQVFGFDGINQFLAIEFVDETRRESDFVGFFLGDPRRRMVKALYADGSVRDVGTLKREAGLESLPTREELEARKTS